MGLIKNCNKCSNVLECYVEDKGIRADDTKLMVILNQADTRILNPVLPGFDSYKITFDEVKTGYLRLILRNSGFDYDDIYLTNIFKGILPKGGKQRNSEYSRIPRKQEYRNCIEEQLVGQIDDFSPKAIVACGGNVFKEMFPDEAELSKFGDYVNMKLQYRNIPTLIFPHPSGVWAIRNPNIQEVYNRMFRDFLKDVSIL